MVEGSGLGMNRKSVGIIERSALVETILSLDGRSNILRLQKGYPFRSGFFDQIKALEEDGTSIERIKEALNIVTSLPKEGFTLQMQKYAVKYRSEHCNDTIFEDFILQRAAEGKSSAELVRELYLLEKIPEEKLHQMFSDVTMILLRYPLKWGVNHEKSTFHTHDVVYQINK